MDLLRQSSIRCPYCGESIDITVDCSIKQQSYIEDCSVCCRPINLDVNVAEEVSITARSENE